MTVAGVRGLFVPRLDGLLLEYALGREIPLLTRQNELLELQGRQLDSVVVNLQQQNAFLRESLLQTSRIELAQQEQIEILEGEIDRVKRQVRRRRIYRWTLRGVAVVGAAVYLTWR